MPSIPTLEAICQGYGITLSQFFAEGEMVELTPDLKEVFDSWSSLSPEQKVEEYIYEDLQTMIKEIHSTVPQLAEVLEVKDIQNMRFEPMYNKIKDFVLQAYKDHEIEIINFYNNVISQYGGDDTIEQEPFSENNVVRQLEKDVLLKVVDTKWIDHLTNIRMLQDSIGLRAYGQKDPLIEYKKESFDLFNNMMFEIQSDTVKHLFRTRFGVQIVNPNGGDDIETSAL